ncbi:MAG: hypothetical protein M3066_14830 [Actinomycetota bacterium]|nr:hypothetical protein [Actinomycetota bacterium]
MAGIGDAQILDPHAQVLAATEEGVVVKLRWREPSSLKVHELFQVLRMREGRIVDIQDHAHRKTALKAVRAPT